MPGKEDGSASPQADDSTFLLLVRGLSDRVPLAEEFQASDRTSEPEEDILFVDQTPPSGAPTMVSDREVEDMVTSGRPSLLLSRNQLIYLAHSQKFPISILLCAP